MQQAPRGATLRSQDTPVMPSRLLRGVEGSCWSIGTGKGSRGGAFMCKARRVRLCQGGLVRTEAGGPFLEFDGGTATG
jgi:hypothetical protein